MDKTVCRRIFGIILPGDKRRKSGKIKWRNINLCLFSGFILFFLNGWLLYLPLPLNTNTFLYVFTLTLGYILLLVAGLWMSRLLKHRLMEDVFNTDNESFMQETRLLEVDFVECFFT